MRYGYLLPFLFFASTAFAQLQKGDGLITLNRGVSSDPTPLPRTVAYEQAGIYLYPAAPALVAHLTPEYTHMLNDKFAVGGQLGLIAGVGDQVGVGLSLLPHARYYFANTEAVMAYGELGLGLVGNTGGGGAVALYPTAGIHLPLTEGILFSPFATLPIDGGSFRLGVGAGLDIAIGERALHDADAVGSLRRGQFMLGASTAGGTLGGGSSLRLHLGGHYFLLDRLALAAHLDVDSRRRNYEGNTRARMYGGLRYYLNQDRRTLWFGEAGLTLFSDGMAVGVGGGAQYFLRDNLALEGGLSVQTPGEGLTIGQSYGFRLLW